jgi:hypothetical protein
MEQRIVTLFDRFSDSWNGDDRGVLEELRQLRQFKLEVRRTFLTPFHTSTLLDTYTFRYNESMNQRKRVSRVRFVIVRPAQAC